MPKTNGIEDKIIELKAEVEALKRRAESAESDWQLAEAENKRFREELERLQGVVGNEDDYKSIEQVLKGK